jgi:hypothetical protein
MKSTFKKGEKVICIRDVGSANTLKIGNLYTVKEESFYYEGLECVSIENIGSGNFFYVTRFKNINKERKIKLKKINESNL